MFRLQEENEILKRAMSIFTKVSLTTNVIELNSDQRSTQMLSNMLDIPRSTYYDTLNKTESN